MDAKFIVVILIIALTIAMTINDFIKRNKEEKIQILINWAKRAVYDAEEFFGSGTGQLKLATVYSAAVKQFPWFAKMLSYEEFDNEVVKPALKWLNKQIADNPNVKSLLNIK